VKHIFIDTNIYLNLYDYSKDDIKRLQALVDLQKSSKLSLYINTQTRNEFYRNREKKIKQTLGSPQFNLPNFTIPRLASQYSQEVNQLQQLFNDFKKDYEALRDKIINDAKGYKLQADSLVGALFCQPVTLSDEVYTNAQKRFARGDPPGKQGSLGDALHWEHLLKAIPDGENLIFITNDGDWISFFDSSKMSQFLLMEWEKRKKSTITLYKNLSSFFKKEFPEIKLDEPNYRQDLLINELRESHNFDRSREILAELIQYLDRLTDQQIIEIIRISLDNFQVYGAHQYSPDLIGHRLHKMLSYIGDVTLLTHELEKEIKSKFPPQ